LMSNQAYGFKKDARFGKQHDVADTKWRILMMTRT
jgi:hypothetical protein